MKFFFDQSIFHYSLLNIKISFPRILYYINIPNKNSRKIHKNDSRQISSKQNPIKAYTRHRPPPPTSNQRINEPNQTKPNQKKKKKKRTHPPLSDQPPISSLFWKRDLHPRERAYTEKEREGGRKGAGRGSRGLIEIGGNRSWRFTRGRSRRSGNANFITARLYPLR